MLLKWWNNSYQSHKHCFLKNHTHSHLHYVEFCQTLRSMLKEVSYSQDQNSRTLAKIKTPCHKSLFNVFQKKESMGYAKIWEIKDAMPKKHEPNKRCHAKKAWAEKEKTERKTMGTLMPAKEWKYWVHWCPPERKDSPYFQIKFKKRESTKIQKYTRTILI
jgi:hypothetical protein